VDAHGAIRVSLRGVKGFHVRELLQACASSLLGFGGHTGAGGGTVAPPNREEAHACNNSRT